MKIPGDDDEENVAKLPGGEEGEEGAAADGLDSQWNKRMKDRLELMKSKKMRDMSITVTQKTVLNGVLASRQRKTIDGTEQVEEKKGSGRIREELEQKTGSILFDTGDSDGTVEVCIQSVLASIKNPTRVSIQVKMASSDKGQYNINDDASNGEDGAPDKLEHGEVRAKMGRLERDLQTLNNRVKACLNNADFNKDQEAAFHQQSVNMNRATTYWPIIQLLILLVTGFTQANHIITYLRTHHIGI